MLASVILSLLLLFMWAAQDADALVTETYSYLEKKGSTSIPIQWQLERGDHLTVTYTRADEAHTTRNDLSFATYQWELRKPSKETRVVAKREGNMIRLEGLFRGEPIYRNLSIDEAPWYQSVTLSLRSLVLSDQPKIEFWWIKPSTLSVYKVKATKQGDEELTIRGEVVPVEKIKISPSGYRGLFWRAFCWFGKRGGQFIKYQGPGGLPGHPETLITLQE